MVQLSAVIESILIATSDAIETQGILDLLKLRRKQVKEELEEISEEEEEERLFLETQQELLKKLSKNLIEETIQGLNTYYEETGRSFHILDTAFGWKIYTNPSYAPFLANLFPEVKSKKLSQPAMETLAIIAYRQPVTKASIESVRGVSSDGMVQKLLDADLVKIAGRSDLPGRPLLYETTDFFYEHFGVRSIDDLPNSQELRNMAWPCTPAEEEADGAPRQMVLGEFQETQGEKTGEEQTEKDSTNKET